MASCKDCIHEKLCVIKAFPDAFENTQWGKKPCDHFKPKTEWISVDERLPEKDGRYLVYGVIGGQPLVCGMYYNKYNGFDGEITHWMPLPEPPKMKEGAE